VNVARPWEEAEFVTAPRDAPGTRFRCALCGARFTHGERVCGACPLAGGCDLVRCPSCGYQFPRESALVEAARRLWSAVGRRR
jgi:hypothetical protein